MKVASIQLVGLTRGQRRMLCVGSVVGGVVFICGLTQIHPWQQMAFPAHPCQHLRHHPIDSSHTLSHAPTYSPDFSSLHMLGTTPSEESSIVWVCYTTPKLS